MDYLKQLSKFTPQARKLIFILDEIGGVPTQLSKTFFSTIRKVYHYGRKVDDKPDKDFYRKIFFIFVGALDLKQLTQGKNSPLSNICETISLDDFSKEEVIGLAKNLENHSEELIEAISEYVYKWCSGHPYLTQRLLKLIEDGKKCHTAEVNEISFIIEELVEKLIYSEDTNLVHILDFLRQNDKTFCRDSVFTILNNDQLKDIVTGEELITVGCIKRQENHCLVIRNLIYEKILKTFFEEEKLLSGK